MLYSTKSPYYRQFLSNAVNKKYLKNIEKTQANVPATENRGNVNPSSVGVWFVISSKFLNNFTYFHSHILYIYPLTPLLHIFFMYKFFIFSIWWKIRINMNFMWIVPWWKLFKVEISQWLKRKIINIYKLKS